MFTSELTTSALQYGLFVEAAYCIYQQGAINPPVSAYTQYITGYNILYNIQMNDFFGNKSSTAEYYGFIAQQQGAPYEIVVAIRGTEGVEEWWDDFHFKLVPFHEESNGNVEEGFYDIYQTLTLLDPETGETGRRLTETLTDSSLIPGLGTVPITITGHSLGAALVTMYAADYALPENVTSPVVYTFASPKVGDRNFAGLYNQLVTANYRIYNYPDIVPQFPSESAYVQVAGGIEINSFADKAVVKSIPCYHALATYLYMLGSGSVGLCPCGKLCIILPQS